MTSLRAARVFIGIVALVLATGCENQPAQILLPNGLTAHIGRPDAAALAKRMLDPTAPTLCFFNSFIDYCYPAPSYCPCPETEIVVPVRSGDGVTMNWLAHPGPDRNIRAYRWALDIADVFDETPRIDEATDLAHWSAWNAAPGGATLGPWNDGEQHRLYVDVGDDMGFRSLGIVRFVVQADGNHSPDCAGARAELSRTWPPNHKLVPVTITGVTGPDGDPVTVTVTGITQDEPIDGGGDGDTCPDAIITGGTARVRLERSGAGNGRVYTLAFTATDDHGDSCSGTVDVWVPRDRSGRDCIKDALVANSLGPCDGGDDAQLQARRR